MIPLAWLAAAVVAAMVGAEGACAQETERALVDFRDPAAWRTDRGVPEGWVVAAANGALWIESAVPEERRLTVLRPAGDEAALDLTGWEEMVWDIANPGAAPLRVRVRFQGGHMDGPAFANAGFVFTLPPGARTAVRCPVFHLPYSYSGWSWPEPWKAWSLGGWGRVNLRDVTGLQVELAGPAAVGLHGIWMSGPAPKANWVDRFGQRANREWAGKVAGEEELIRADREEAAYLAGCEPMPDRDEYQAWTGAPALPGAGFFRVTRREGRWWLVAPNGRLYFSTAIAVVIPSGPEAPVTEMNRSAFQWLPPREGAFGRAWYGDNVSFDRVNMMRKWGARGWEEWSVARARERLRVWGFTGFGNWTPERVAAGARMPWVNVGPNWWWPPADAPRVGALREGLIHDVFDPAFEAEALRLARNGVERFKEDPWLIGHFILNEVGWDHFFRCVLDQGPKGAARREFLAGLEAKYGTIEALNAAWGTAAVSFVGLEWDDALRRDPEGAPMRDMREFRERFADRWYGAWSRAIRTVDPNHLVLGSRLSAAEREEDIVRACARHCDVVSFNDYSILPDMAEFARLHEIAQRPFLIGEFGHNTLESGHLTAAAPVATQAERGAAFRRFVEALAAAPYFVGVHHFQYRDEPATGRSDSETSANGFVAITDIPWPAMVEAARASNRVLYEVHAGLRAPAE